MCSMFLPRSSIRTFRPFSVSSLAAQPPEIPEPTTIASYCVDCIRALVWKREFAYVCQTHGKICLLRKRRAIGVPLGNPRVCIISRLPRNYPNHARSRTGHMVAHDALSPWESFYVIVGSSAAALTGLQFVVMALVSETQSRAGTHEIEAFATPNVVHFCVVLLLSAILSSPWPSLHALAVCAGIVAAAGVVYALIVARR